MPTRLVLNERVAARKKTPRFRLTNTNAPSSRCRSSILSEQGQDNSSSRELERRKSSRRVVSLRSSILRNTNDGETFRALSSEDIRASPRLLGYCFQFLASLVMLISVSSFFGERNNETENSIEIWDIFNSSDDLDGKKLYYSKDSRAVFAWKLFGCFVISGLGTIMSLGIIVAHFDTVCFPSYWMRNFRDGSKIEQAILVFLASFWAVGLHINTSSLSVGETQANVYFTSWISFFSSVLNYGIWRVSSGHRSIADMFIEHHRETTYNWLWVLFCSLIFALSICDTYYNREYLKLYFQGQELNIEMRRWVYVLTIPWMVVMVSLLSIVLNHFLRKACEIRICGGRFVLMGWRQAEGLMALGMTGILFWIVFSYTGGNGVFNGLNNVYFGVWGAFINSVMLLSTWLRENKSIDTIRKEERNRAGQRGAPSTV